MKRIKRILALIGAVFLAALYIITLLCAVFDNRNSMALFQASVLCTVIIPALIWAYTLIYRLAKGGDDKSEEDAGHSDRPRDV